MAMREARVWIWAVAVLLLAGCADRLTTDVTRFHKLAPPAGETLRVVPADPTLDKTPEFRAFAQMIGAHLGDYGYRPAPPGTEPDIYARISYGVGPGPVANPDAAQSPVSVGVGVGGIGRHVGGGVSTEFGLPSGSQSLFRRELRLVLVRRTDQTILFEGRASSLGKSDRLTAVMPYLVDAMFKDFPGKSGRTVTVTAKVQPR